MSNELTATLARTSGTVTLGPVAALTRFTPVKLAGTVLAVEQGGDLRFGVRIANLGLLIPAAVICEVVDGFAVHALPNVPSWFPGMINLRGNLVPVFDLNALCAGEAANLGRLLVVDRGDRAAAIPIDVLPKPLSMQAGSRTEQRPPAPVEIEPCVRGAHLIADELWLELDFAALFETLGDRAGR